MILHLTLHQRIDFLERLLFAVREYDNGTGGTNFPNEIVQSPSAMAFENQSLQLKRFPSPFFWLATGIVLFIFSNGRSSVPPAAWLAPPFLLRFLRLNKTVFGLSLLFVLVFLSILIMLHEIIPSLLGLPAYLLMLNYDHLLLPSYYLIFRLFAHRGGGKLTLCTQTYGIRSHLITKEKTT